MTPRLQRDSGNQCLRIVQPQEPGMDASMVLRLQWGQEGIQMASISKCKHLWGEIQENVQEVHGGCADYWLPQ